MDSFFSSILLASFSAHHTGVAAYQAHGHVHADDESPKWKCSRTLKNLQILQSFLNSWISSASNCFKFPHLNIPLHPRLKAKYTALWCCPMEGLRNNQEELPREEQSMNNIWGGQLGSTITKKDHISWTPHISHHSQTKLPRNQCVYLIITLVQESYSLLYNWLRRVWSWMHLKGAKIMFIMHFKREYISM